MGGAVGPNLAADVSNTGGLGLLRLWFEDIETPRNSIGTTQALTSAPFAVNLNMEFPQEERLEACLEESVPIISFLWKDPSPLIRRAKDAGAIVMHTVADTESAKRAFDSGVDVTVAQGWEAGGSSFKAGAGQHETTDAPRDWPGHRLERARTFRAAMQALRWIQTLISINADFQRAK